MRNNTHAHNIFPGERNLLKTPMLACINMMNRDVLQFLCSFKHNLQVNNLSLCSLRSSDPYLVNFYLCLSPYFLTQLLEKLGPYYLGNSSNWLHNIKVDHLTACNTYTLKTSLQLLLQCLGISTTIGKLKFSAHTSYFGFIDQLTRWSLS